MKHIAIIMALVATFAAGEWIMEPEGFEDGVTFIVGSFGNPLYWFAPDYHEPMFVYSPGFESDSAVGSGAMSWPSWWGNFIRTPIQDCSSADSVVLSFRMWNTADPSDNDYARFYVWVGPDVGGSYCGTVTVPMGTGDARDWELMNIDFTDCAAGESQVYFYLEANFGTGSFTRECKFDDIGVASSTVLDVEEERDLPQDFSISAYPNPFNSAVKIVFDVPSVETQNLASLRIEIFDIAGRRVADAEPVEAGAGWLTNVTSTLRQAQGTASSVSDVATAKLPSTQTGCKQGSGSVFAPLYNRGSYVWRPDPSVTSGVYLVRASFDRVGLVSRLSGQGTESISKRVVYLK